MSVPGGRIALVHGVQSSATTWWRVGADLGDLGYDVLTPNLPGDGGRAVAATPTMAADVADQLDGTVDLLVGHCLGALVSLTVAVARPDVAGALVLEDPPALGPDLDPADVADSIEREVARARAEPEAVEADTLRQNPLCASEPESATTAPARAEILAAADAVVEVESGHSIHRDRPGVWIATVLRSLPDA